MTQHTICLGGFDLLKEGLEPTKGRRITANPEELDTTKRAKVTLLLSVPNVFENRSKWRNTYMVGKMLILVLFERTIFSHAYQYRRQQGQQLQH
jgi:hypothetical protein